jgi:hypothetical protein
MPIVQLALMRDDRKQIVYIRRRRYRPFRPIHPRISTPTSRMVSHPLFVVPALGKRAHVKSAREADCRFYFGGCGAVGESLGVISSGAHMRLHGADLELKR